MALLLVLSASVAGAQEGARRGGLALVGATVIDVVSGARTPNTTVLLQGDRIVGMGPAGTTRVPSGARVVRLPGKFIIPGLWDMHVEQALPLWDRAPVDSNAGFFHPLFLAYGVTGVRDVAGPVAVLGRWKDEIARGMRVGPRLVYSGPKLGAAPVAPGAPFPVTTRNEVSRSVALLKEGGASAVYVLQLRRDLYPTLFADARSASLAVEGSIPYTTSLWDAATNGQRVVDHLDAVLASSSTAEAALRRWQQAVDERPWWARVAWKLRLMRPPSEGPQMTLEDWSAARANSLFVHLAAHRTFQVPTLRLLGTVYRSADSAVRLPPRPLQLRAPRRPVGGWPSAPLDPADPRARVHDKMRWSVGAMQRAGVPIMAGSDTPNLYAAPGLSLHDELALLVRAGLSPLQALQSATWRPAQYLAATDTLGSVSAGTVADLVVLDADPTLDIAATRAISYVVSRGRLYDRAALDSMRARGTSMARDIEQFWLMKESGRK